MLHKVIWIIICLCQVNAKHRKGHRINDQTDEQVIDHAIEELNELKEAPDDPMELADAMSILIHYAIRKQWNIPDLENLMIQKLKERFSDAKLVDPTDEQETTPVRATKGTTGKRSTRAKQSRRRPRTTKKRTK